MMKLLVFNLVLLEPGLPKLPIQMTVTVFKYMTKGSIVIWVLEIIKYWMPDCHVYNVTKTVEIGGRAD